MCTQIKKTWCIVLEILHLIVCERASGILNPWGITRYYYKAACFRWFVSRYKLLFPHYKHTIFHNTWLTGWIKIFRICLDAPVDQWRTSLWFLKDKIASRSYGTKLTCIVRIICFEIYFCKRIWWRLKKTIPSYYYLFLKLNWFMPWINL